MAKHRQVVSAGEAGGAASDDRNLAPFAVGGCGPGGFTAQLRQVPGASAAGAGLLGAFALGHQFFIGIGLSRFRAVALRQKALERTDGNQVVDLSPAAGILTGRGADPAADRRQRVGRAGDEEGFVELAFRDELDVAARVGMDRAGLHAGDIPAIPGYLFEESFVLRRHSLRPLH